MKLQFALLLTVATLLNHAAPAAAAAEARDLALEGAKVYSSPAAAPIENAVVLIQHGRIAAVGKRSEVKVPASAQVIDCTGKVIVAGFWNSHVHFENGWQGIAQVPAAQVDAGRRRRCSGAHPSKSGK
jgi:predicted amidohydrolase YtcJ